MNEEDRAREDRRDPSKSPSITKCCLVLKNQISCKSKLINLCVSQLHLEETIPLRDSDVIYSMHMHSARARKMLTAKERIIGTWGSKSRRRLTVFLLIVTLM